MWDLHSKQVWDVFGLFLYLLEAGVRPRACNLIWTLHLCYQYYRLDTWYPSTVFFKCLHLASNTLHHRVPWSVCRLRRHTNIFYQFCHFKWSWMFTGSSACEVLVKGIYFFLKRIPWIALSLCWFISILDKVNTHFLAGVIWCKQL